MKYKVNKSKYLYKKDKNTICSRFIHDPSIFDDLLDHDTNRCLLQIIAVINKFYQTEKRFNRDINHYTAQSVCCDTDTFNEKTGDEIASAKSDWKFHHNMASRYDFYGDFLSEMIYRMHDLKTFHEVKCANISNWLREKHGGDD